MNFTNFLAPSGKGRKEVGHPSLHPSLVLYSQGDHANTGQPTAQHPVGPLCLASLHMPFHVGPLSTSKEGAAARARFRKQDFLALKLDVSAQPACQV